MVEGHGAGIAGSWREWSLPNVPGDGSPGLAPGQPPGRAVRSGVVRVYVEVARRAFRRFATYRGATVAALFTNTVFGILLTSVVAAVVRSRGGAPIDGLDRDGLVTQIWLGQGLIGVVNIFFRTPDLTERIRTGDVVVDLLPPDRPPGVVGVRSTSAGPPTRSSSGSSPPSPWGCCCSTPGLPALVDVPAVVVAMVLALAVSFGLRFLASASGFWVLDARGVERVLLTVWLFGSGMTIPLPLLPDQLEAAVSAAAVRRHHPGRLGRVDRDDVAVAAGGARRPGGLGRRPARRRAGRAGPGHAQGGGAGWLTTGRCRSTGGWSGPRSARPWSTRGRSRPRC